jgi:DNA gyrase/topoisomerase IV subunit A
MHIVEGLLLALQQVDQVIDLIRTSSLSVNDQLKLSRLVAEIRLRVQLLDVELQLDRKRSSSHVYMTKKRRKKLESKVQAL